jgi:hypothetical protein
MTVTIFLIHGARRLDEKPGPGPFEMTSGNESVYIPEAYVLPIHWVAPSPQRAGQHGYVIWDGGPKCIVDASGGVSTIH